MGKNHGKPLSHGFFSQHFTIFYDHLPPIPGVQWIDVASRDWTCPAEMFVDDESSFPAKRVVSDMGINGDTPMASNSWMVYLMEFPIQTNDLEVAPWLRKPPNLVRPLTKTQAPWSTWRRSDWPNPPSNNIWIKKLYGNKQQRKQHKYCGFQVFKTASPIWIHMSQESVKSLKIGISKT